MLHKHASMYKALEDLAATTVERDNLSVYVYTCSDVISLLWPNLPFMKRLPDTNPYKNLNVAFKRTSAI